MQHEVGCGLEKRLQTMRAMCSALWPMEWREIQCQLGIVPDAGNESVLRANLHLGTYIVRIVGLTRGDTMDLSKYDRTQLDAKWRRQCWRNGNRVKTRMWLDRNGAKRDTSENKIVRSVYRKLMRDYWITLDPRTKERAERMRIYTQTTRSR